MEDLPRTHGSASAAPGFRTYRGGELCQESSDHSDAILDLRKVRIVTRRWNPGARHDVDLVAQPGEWRPDPALELPLNRRDVSDQFPRILRAEGPQDRQILPMIGKPHRHDRKRRGVRMKPQEIVDCPLEMRAIVEIRAQHHLAVQLNSG